MALFTAITHCLDLNEDSFYRNWQREVFNMISVIIVQLFNIETGLPNATIFALDTCLVIYYFNICKQTLMKGDYYNFFQEHESPIILIQFQYIENCGRDIL